MTSASNTGPARSIKVEPQVIEGRVETGNGPRGRAVAAAVTTAFAALAAVAAIALGVVEPTSSGGPGPGVAAASIVAVAPIVVVALLAIITAGPRPALAGALTGGYGVVSVGLTVVNLGLVTSPIDANRLELFRPVTAEALTAGLGAYLSVAAQALAVVGGLVGLIAVGRASFADGYGHSPRADLTGRASAVRIGGTLSVLAVVSAVAAAAALFMAPYISSDSIVLIRAIVESPLSTAVGSGAVALAVLIVVATALASISPPVAAGSVLAAGLGVLGVFGARVVAGIGSGPGVEVSLGAWIGTVAAVALVAVGILALPASALRDRRGIDREVTRAVSSEEGQVGRWHVAAGITGVLAGVLLGASAVLPVLDVPDGFANPTIYAARTVLIAGFVLVVGSVSMFFSLFAATVRPALGVIAAAAIMAAAGVLQSIALSTDIDGIGIGVGGIVTILGSAVAVVCGLAVLLAGSAERDDVDTSDLPVARTVAPVALAGGIASAIALGLPLYRGADVSAASFVELPWGLDAWGQATLAVTVLVAAVVAARSRPARGTSLLVGSALAMIVYVLGWPLTRARALDPVVGPGAVVGGLAVVILAVAAVLSVRRQAK